MQQQMMGCVGHGRQVYVACNTESLENIPYYRLPPTDPDLAFAQPALKVGLTLERACCNSRLCFNCTSKVAAVQTR